MSAGARLDWKHAAALARRASDLLAPTVEQLKCVGSIRRRRPTIGDVEFLARPCMDTDLLGDEMPSLGYVRAVLMGMGTWVKGQGKMMQITDLLGVEGLKLDLYLCTPPASWGSLLAIRTGPADLGRYVVTVCREHGYRHTGGHAVRLDSGQRVSTETEEEFFALATVPCVPPRERAVLSERLWTEYRRQRVTT